MTNRLKLLAIVILSPSVAFSVPYLLLFCLSIPMIFLFQFPIAALRVNPYSASQSTTNPFFGKSMANP